MRLIALAGGYALVFAIAFAVCLLPLAFAVWIFQLCVTAIWHVPVPFWPVFGLASVLPGLLGYFARKED